MYVCGIRHVGAYTCFRPQVPELQIEKIGVSPVASWLGYIVDRFPSGCNECLGSGVLEKPPQVNMPSLINPGQKYDC